MNCIYQVCCAAAQEDPMNGRHDAPAAPRVQPLYDTDVPTPSHSEYAQTLVAGVTHGTLCTVARKPAGHPYGSFVTFAMDGASPIFLISHLAEHTRNLLRDSRASFLVTEDGEGDPLARGRVTLVGECAKLEGPAEHQARDAYLAAHPSAEAYIDWRDFSLWALRVQSARYIGGFGRMSWVDEAQWGSASPNPLIGVRAGIIAHMNDDHTDAMECMCRAFTRADDFSQVTMTDIDQYGFNMEVLTADGPRPVRLGFDRHATNANEARVQLVALTRKARRAIGD